MDKAYKQMGKRGALQLKPRIMAQACSLALVALSMGYAPHAAAEAFTLDNGDQGQWTAGISLGDAWRTRNPDPALYSHVYNNGGRLGSAGDGNQDGDLNFGKGAPFSTPVNLEGEVQLKHDNLGLVFGARAWYDEALENGTVKVGNYVNGFNAATGGQPGAKLSDAGFESQSKFEGAALTNAYVFGTFEPIDGKPLTVKLGDQVVNWGESLFIPGLNQFGAFNYQALVTPGATIKDALLPIPQVDANWGLGGGLSLEAFYQFTWVKNVFPGCGTFWSPSDLLNCGTAPGSLLGDGTSGVNQYTQLNGVPLLAALKPFGVAQASQLQSFGVSAVPEINAKNSGQFGASLHYYADSIGTDFGFYVAAFNQRTPMLDLYATPSNVANSLYAGNVNGSSLLSIIGTVEQNGKAAATAAATAAGKAAAAAVLAAGGTPAAAGAAAQTAAGKVAAAYTAQITGAITKLAPLSLFTQPLQAGWDYSAPTIEEAGVSAATTVAGWSLAGEASFTKGVPVQFNPGDMVTGYLVGQSPTGTATLGALGGAAAAEGKAFNAGAGPLAGVFANDLKNGTLMQGFDLHNKIQIQMNTAKVISQVAGAESLTLVGEIGIQKWSGIGDPSVEGNIRYGRAFTYGVGSANSSTPGVNAAICSLNPNQSYCGDAGYDTPTAWGYRGQAELSYPNAIAGWNLKPKVFWSADVHGYSADGLFVQNREVLGLSLRTDYNNKYYASLTYTAFNHDATYDPMHDRDNIALVAGMTF
jgi:hypothetical protein